MNIPNFVTLLRILLIPIMTLCFYLPWHGSNLLCAAIFSVAALTDWLDGYLARTLKQTSNLGAFLDPVADKLIVVVALILLVGSKQLPLLAIPTTVIVGREIVISALREWMAELGKRTHVAVSQIGKIKTAAQMLAIIVLLSYRPGAAGFTGLWLGILGYILLCAAAVLTLWSMVLYLRAAWSDLSFDAKHSA